MIYQWKPGGHFGKVTAQATGERLECLRETHGTLTAELVVDDARNPKAVLHPAFEWRDEVAAEEFRKEQARSLIRSVVVVPNDASEDTPLVRAFVVVGDVGDLSYTSMHVAMADETMRQQIVARALRELRQFQAKYSELTELAEVFAAANKIAVAA
jgi:hypothetical protein